MHFFGLGGARVSSNAHLTSFSSALRRFRPTNVIVILGGNDLDDDQSVQDIVYKLIAYLSMIRTQFDLRHITVTSFFPRTSTRQVSPDEYSARVQDANQELKQACENTPFTYWRLKGFFLSRENILSDGVHLNDLGQYKLFRHLRGILLSHLGS